MRLVEMQCLNCYSFKMSFIHPPQKLKFVCLTVDEDFCNPDKDKIILVDMAVCRDCGFVEFFCNAFTHQPININQLFKSS